MIVFQTCVEMLILFVPKKELTDGLSNHASQYYKIFLLNQLMRSYLKKIHRNTLMRNEFMCLFFHGIGGFSIIQKQNQAETWGFKESSINFR